MRKVKFGQNAAKKFTSNLDSNYLLARTPETLPDTRPPNPSVPLVPLTRTPPAPPARHVKPFGCVQGLWDKILLLFPLPLSPSTATAPQKGCW